MMENTAIGRLLNESNAKVKGGALARHLATIQGGNVTKTNVIGLRKGYNAHWRRVHGYGASRTGPTWTDGDMQTVQRALRVYQPIVRGDLHASGVRLLTDRRYAKRLAPVADKLAKLEGFSLIGFHFIGRGGFTPIYRAWGSAGGFSFYAVSWQSAWAYGLQGGPHILESK